MASRSFSVHHNLVSEDEEELSKKDVDRLSSIWRSVKESKRYLNSSKSFLDSNLQNAQEKDVSSELPPRQKDDLLLDKARDSNKQLLKRLKDAHSELEECHAKIARLVNTQRSDKRKIEEIEEKLAKHAQSQKEVLDRSRANASLLEETLEEKERRVVDLQNKSEETRIQMAKLVDSQAIAVEEKHRAIAELEDKAEENIRLQQIIQEVEKEADNWRRESQDNTKLKIELDHLRSEVTRLLQLLSQAGSELRELSLEGESMRYLKNQENFVKNFKSQTTKNKCKRICSGCVKEKEVNEKQLWVPKDTMEFAQQLNEREGNAFSQEVIEELLFGLQLIWKEQEQNQISRINKQHEREISELKRQVDKQLPFDEVEARNKMKRLRSEMSKFKRDQESGMCTSKTDQNCQGNQKEKIIYFQDALKLFKEYECELREAKEDTLRLKEKIEKNSKDNDICDKIIYLEGALWMSEKLVAEAEKVGEISVNSLAQFMLDIDQIEENHNLNIAIQMARQSGQVQARLHQEFLQKADSLKRSVKNKIIRANMQKSNKYAEQGMLREQSGSKQQDQNSDKLQRQKASVRTQYDSESRSSNAEVIKRRSLSIEEWKIKNKQGRGDKEQIDVYFDKERQQTSQENRYKQYVDSQHFINNSNNGYYSQNNNNNNQDSKQYISQRNDGYYDTHKENKRENTVGGESRHRMQSNNSLNNINNY